MPIGPCPTSWRSLADSFNQMAAALEESERQRRDIIANIAHELRTPLTNLEGYLEAIRDGVIVPDRQTFESLLEETERLARLARSLDDLADGRPGRPSAGTGRRRPGAAARRRPWSWSRPTFEARQLGLERHWPRPLAGPCRPRPGRPGARQPAPERGPLRAGRRRRVALAAEPLEDIILVSLSNSGEAIPAADLPHLFERFYRVEKSRDRAPGGAGIGLAIVKQLVEGWGGRVGAESTPGPHPLLVQPAPVSARRLMPSICRRMTREEAEAHERQRRRLPAADVHAQADALDEPRPTARLWLEHERPAGPEGRHVVISLEASCGPERSPQPTCASSRSRTISWSRKSTSARSGSTTLRDEAAVRLGRHEVADGEGPGRLGRLAERGLRDGGPIVRQARSRIG